MLSDSPGTPGRSVHMPADDQVDLHAGLRGPVERVDGLLVDQRVHLELHQRLRRRRGRSGPARSIRSIRPAADAVRRHQQPAERGLPAVTGEHVEQVGDVGADLGIGGEHAEVLVQPGGLRVVVAGADVAVAADLVALLAYHQRGLAVRLEADQAVDDVAAGPLQGARPADVGHLVEAGLHLDQHHHLLAGGGRVDQRVDDRRVAAGAVERLLDGQHVRVGGGLLDEALHAGGERVVRVVHQDVALAQPVEDAARHLAVGQLRVGGRDERAVLEVVAVALAVDLPQRGQVEQAGHPQHVLAVHVELADRAGRARGR